MDVLLSNSKLNGEVTIPPSKSILHRALICAALADGTSRIQNTYLSQDILATIDCLKQLGAEFEVAAHSITVTGIRQAVQKAAFDCRESGSTIRFMIPVAAALGIDSVFTGSGRLVTRPLDSYKTAFCQKGVQFRYNGTLPVPMEGQLLPGNYTIQGNISSQFITGLLFALPLLDGDSTITVLPPFESKSYVEITLSVLQSFGIIASFQDDTYLVKGNQQYLAQDYYAESDYSQAAFFLTANCLGSSVALHQFAETSVQGDRQILSILSKAGVQNHFCDGKLTNTATSLHPFEVDASDIPDLVPILCVLASFCQGRSAITNVERLRLKESDRIASSIDMITNLGGKIEYRDKTIWIDGVSGFHGGTVDSCNDHRIAMCTAIAATCADGDVTLIGADCIKKSYPSFFEDYQNLGGICNVIHVE